MGSPRELDFSAAAQNRPPLLLIVGTDADTLVQSGNGYRISGNSDIFRLIPPNIRFDQLNLTRQFRKAHDRVVPGHYPVVLNLVTDPDQHPRTLERVRKLMRGYRGRLINRPEAVLRTTRDQVAKRLATIPNLRAPRTVRLKVQGPHSPPKLMGGTSLSYPAILRQAGTHGGKIIGRVETASEATALLDKAGEYILTEFVDFRSPDGLYRKYRVFFIGQRRIFRHLIGAEDWNIHAKERFAFMATHPGLIAEERDMLESPDGNFPPEVAATLDAVRQHMGLDFFGVDFGLAPDGQVVLFEANATMNFFPVRDEPPFEHIKGVLSPASLAFGELLRSKLAATAATAASSTAR